jgi:hypothetical protein
VYLLSAGVEEQLEIVRYAPLICLCQASRDSLIPAVANLQYLLATPRHLSLFSNPLIRHYRISSEAWGGGGVRWSGICISFIYPISCCVFPICMSMTYCSGTVIDRLYQSVRGGGPAVFMLILCCIMTAYHTPAFTRPNDPCRVLRIQQEQA